MQENKTKKKLMPISILANKIISSLKSVCRLLMTEPNSHGIVICSFWSKESPERNVQNSINNILLLIYIF